MSRRERQLRRIGTDDVYERHQPCDPRHAFILSHATEARVALVSFLNAGPGDAGDARLTR